jgi:hypothetical protein
MTGKNPNGGQLAGQHFNVWLRHYDTPEFGRQSEKLPIRRDMITLLTYVQDNKVVGTQSTGNMPLKAVRDVTARFVNPPQLDTTIGERTYRLRSETEVWSLYYLHILAEVGKLLKVAPARRWQLTSNGKKFLNNPPLIQVMYLFTIWWNQVNWLVAYPVQGMGENLPSFFNVFTLGHLQETCAVGKAVSFEKFADGLIEKTGLVWTAQDSSFARIFLHSSIERMVIEVLVTFGGANCKYREKPLGSGTTLELDTFELTQFGRALLDAVAIMIS